MHLRLSAMLLLGGEPGTCHLSQMAVAIGNVCTSLHHVTPSTLMVGQQGWLGQWIHPDINSSHLHGGMFSIISCIFTPPSGKMMHNYSNIQQVQIGLSVCHVATCSFHTFQRRQQQKNFNFPTVGGIVSLASTPSNPLMWRFHCTLVQNSTRRETQRANPGGSSNLSSSFLIIMLMILIMAPHFLVGLEIMT